MSYPISLELVPKQGLSQKQTQRLMMTPQMQQAIHLLQLPIMELSKAIEEEMEKNPVLEFEENDGSPAETEAPAEEEKEMNFDEQKLDILKQLDDEFSDYLIDNEEFTPRKTLDDQKKRVFLETSIQSKPSLNEYLLTQAREAFPEDRDFRIAEIVIGYLEEEGFLKTPLQEIAIFAEVEEKKIEEVLSKIQTFDPVGIGTQNLEQLLLLQLKAKKKEDSLAYQVISHHFDDLLHNRLQLIQKKLRCPIEEIQKAIDEDISHLNLHPCINFSQVDSPTLVPDVKINQVGENLETEVNEGDLQPIRLNHRYLKMLNDPALSAESKDFIKSKLMSAKWLVRNLEQRSSTLFKIAEFLIKHQREFLSSTKGNLVPLTMKTVADELSLHESTIARAVGNKYIDTPRGIYPLRYFFSNAYVDEQGHDVSSQTVKDLLREIIHGENKKKPFSDEKLSKLLHEKGIACARRTIAKYRDELEIGNTQQRKKF